MQFVYRKISRTARQASARDAWIEECREKIPEADVGLRHPNVHVMEI